MKLSIKTFFSKCYQIRRKLLLVTFIEEILNGKLYFLCGVNQPRTTGTPWHGIVAYHLPEAKHF